MKLRRKELEDAELGLEDDELDLDSSDSDSKDDDLFKEDIDFSNDNDFFGGSGGSTGEKYSDLLKELTNFNVYVKNKINGWLGKVWNEEKGMYVNSPDLEPIMNTKCAQWCIDFMKTYTRGNNIITDISQGDYKSLYQDIASVVWIDLGTKAEEFSITSNQDLHKIGTELIHSALLVLMGAGDGKYNKLLGTATHRNENVSYNMPMGGSQQPSKKVGLLASFRKKLVGG